MSVSKVSRTRVTALRNPTYSQGSVRVDPIQKTSPADIVGNKNLNYEFSKENFYDQLDKQKEKESEKDFENKKRQQQNKKNVAKPKEKEKYIFSKEERDTLDSLKRAFDTFNKKIDEIKNVDRLMGNANLTIFKTNTANQTKFLASIGIYTDKFSHFYIKEEMFVNEIKKYPSKLRQLTDPSSGTLRAINTWLGKVS